MKENTREEILVQTFKLLDESSYTTISMAQIAARVGISKTAIYRHFVSKEALFASLKTRFFDDLAACLAELEYLPPDREICSRGERQKPLFHMLTFFAAHPQYLTFFLASLSNESRFEGETLAAMKERGLKSYFYQENDLYSEKTLGIYIHFLYASATSIYFINEKKHICPDGDPTVFAKKLGSFLLYGWSSLQNSPDLNFDKLDRIARIDISEMPEESRIFTALTNTIDQYGFLGVTIERLSSFLGMAKSSLYTYFENKNELITRLIIEEMMYLRELLKNRIEQGKTVPEMVYIHLQTMLSYLLLRPSILTVCAWLRLRGTTIRTTMNDIFNEDSFSYYGKIKIPDFDITMSDYSMSGWVSMLPISILLQCQYHKIPEEQLFQIMRQVFYFMKEGLEEQERQMQLQCKKRQETSPPI